MTNLRDRSGLYREIQQYLITEPNGEDRSIVTTGNVKFYVPGLDWPLEIPKSAGWARSLCQFLDWSTREVLVMRVYEKDPENGLFLKRGYDSGVRGFNQMRAEIYYAVQEISAKEISSEIASQEEVDWVMRDRAMAGQFDLKKRKTWSLPWILTGPVT